MKKVAIIAAALAFISGCGETKKPKDTAKQGSFPVQQPYVAPIKPGPGPIKANESEGPKKIDEPKPVDPPVAPVEPAKPVQPPPADPFGQSPGSRAREFALSDADGNPFVLSKFRGDKAVLVVIGATWCPTCNNALPAAMKAYDKYNAKGLVLAEVFLGEDASITKPFAEKKGLKHTLLPDPNQLIRTKFNYDVPDMPVHILIGKDGKVVASGGSVPTDAQIEAALK